MIESEQKRTKQCYFQLNYIETLFICCKRVYSCCFSLGGNLDFLDFLQKSFITSTTGCTYIRIIVSFDDLRESEGHEAVLKKDVAPSCRRRRLDIRAILAESLKLDRQVIHILD